MIDWQPIETAPKDGTIVLLWCVDDHCPATAVSGFWDETMWLHRSIYAYASPTHWAPISPPEGA